MKLKNLMLSLSLAGLCLHQASSQVSAQSARHIGDGRPVSVGDLRPAEFRANRASLASSESNVVAPTAMAYGDTLTSSGDIYYENAPHGSYSIGCSSGCDDGCDSCSGGKGLLAGLKGNGKLFFSAESLLWFAPELSSPALVTTSAQGELPVLPDASTAFGGNDGISYDLLPGFRIEGGAYLDDCQKFGVSGRAYGIFQGKDTYHSASDGSTSLGIPFYNINPAVLAEDAFLVAFTAPTGAPISAGEINARSDLDMLGAEASIRVLLARSGDNRVDLIGGYTYNRLKNSIGMHATSTNLNTGDLIPDGTVFDIDDLIATENEFHGGHLGLLSSVTRKGLSLKTLAKVSFGNMRQSAEARGYTVQSYQGSSTATAGGIFTSPENIGVFQQDVFAFIPELGAKLGYKATDNIELTVGYTFMYWSAVGLAGDQIQRVIDPADTIAPPVAGFVDSGFWMQGVDLGATLTF